MARLLQQYSAAPTTLRTVFVLRHFNTSQQHRGGTSQHCIAKICDHPCGLCFGVIVHVAKRETAMTRIGPTT
jgi:hypothetical protein